MPEIKYMSEPLHRDVKRVRKLQKKILFRLMDLGNVEVDKNMEVQEFIAKELGKDPARLAELQDGLEEFGYTATIILSTGMKEVEIEALSEVEFWECYEKSKEALGGRSADDFLERYSGAMSLTAPIPALSESKTSASMTEQSSPAASKGRSKAGR